LQRRSQSVFSYSTCTQYANTHTHTHHTHARIHATGVPRGWNRRLSIRSAPQRSPKVRAAVVAVVPAAHRVLHPNHATVNQPTHTSPNESGIPMMPLTNGEHWQMAMPTTVPCRPRNGQYIAERHDRTQGSGSAQQRLYVFRRSATQDGHAQMRMLPYTPPSHDSAVLAARSPLSERTLSGR